MDRIIVYPGQIPTDAMLLNSNKNAMVALARLAAAALGVNGVVNGLAVTPTSPASLNVNVAAGEIYLLENTDTTSYGSIAADTTHQILKQGISQDVTQLGCAAPGTGGQSINYLIQAAFSETDTGSVALPYYNASNPSVAWSGPNNSGTPQATARQDLCVVTVKAGTAATTGTQTTPTPDAGNIGLAVVTVANGQATITAANIVQYTGAALVPSDGLASNVSHAGYTKSVAGNTDVTLTAQEAAYPILTLTGALTGNINLIVPATSRQRIICNQTSGAYQITVKTAAGTGIVAPQGLNIPMLCDGTNVQSQVSALLTQAQGDARYYTQTAADARYPSAMSAIDCTQSGGALTFSSAAPFLSFRNSSLTNGTPSVVSGAPANLVLPLAGSLGVPTTLSGRIVLAEMNNAGTRELAVCNIAGGLPMTEEGLISTTAIGSGSTANNVWYSTTGRSNLPYRIIGALDVVWTTGGTGWSSPTTKICAGGNALTAMSSLGYGQTWQAVTRVSGTTYYNTTGKPIVLVVNITMNNTGNITVVVNGVTVYTISFNGIVSGTLQVLPPVVIPVGASYVITTPATLTSTAELR